MKYILAATLLTCQFAFANAGDSLKQNMKQANVLLKSIVAGMQDTSRNQENATAAAKIAELFTLTLEQVPDVVGDLPADQKAAAIADYQQMIQDEIHLAQQLSAAFAANDNAGAVKIIQQMKDLKEKGHDKYNP